MKRNYIKRTMLVLISVLLMATPISGGSSTDSTVQSYEDRLAYTEEKQQAALAELERLQSEQAGAWYELTQYDQLININEQKKKLAEEQLVTLEKQISEKSEEILDISASLELHEDAFLRRMASSYMEGEMTYLDILFGAKSIGEFLTRVDRINAVRASDKALIKRFNDEKDSLNAAKQTLEKARELQEKTILDFESAIRDTAEMYAAKESLLAELQSSEEEAKAVYEYYRQQEDVLNAELESYLAELQRKQQTVYVGGTFAWPLDPSAPYRYSSEFGWRMLWGEPDNHRGIDIACAQNTKILAANSGTVLISEWHWSYGNYVLIDHGGGIATLYAHMTSRAVVTGETVSIGQVIGFVGETGNAKGHHLHFEVRRNGELQQPRDYIVGPNG